MKRLSWVGIGFALCATAYARTNSIGDASDGLFDPVLFATTLMRYACYVTGASLCMGAILQYRTHLENPKLTPLFTPILLLCLGIATIFFPYLTTMFGNSWSAEEQAASGNKGELREGRNPAKAGQQAPAEDTYWGTSGDTDTSGADHWGDGT